MCSHLDGAVVDQETVHLRESLAGAVRMVEDDRGDTTADTTGAVGQLDSLDLTDSLVEVVLFAVEG